MLCDLERKVVFFAGENGLFESEGRALLAVSGGADSTALMYVISALQAERVLTCEVVCAHINHQLRGSESDQDERFVVELAKDLGFAVTTRRVDVRRFSRERRLSIETAARKLRLESLLEIAEAGGCDLVLTGHQMDDNAETVVQRLARGTGFRGLCGIWPRRTFGGGVDFVRPLLCVKRDEIVEYLKGRNLRWREDLTNLDCGYRRNFVRHRVLPALESESSCPVAEQLFGLSRSAQRFHKLVCNRIEDVWPKLADCAQERVVLDTKGFCAEPAAVRVELIRRGLVYLGSGERDLAAGHFEKLQQFAAETVGGRKVVLPGGFSVVYEYGKMIFARSTRALKGAHELRGRVIVTVPGQTRFGRYLIESAILAVEAGQEGESRKSGIKYVECFDFDKLALPLEVRSRGVGERFVPLGLHDEKKVGKFLSAQRVPQKIRKQVLVVSDTEKIIWVWPVRMSERAKVSDGTRKILRLEIIDARGGMSG